MSEDQRLDAVNEIKAKEWNETIAPNLESIRSMFRSVPWTNGVGAYLAHVREQQIASLANSKTDREEHILLGRLSMLQEILAMPKAIDNHIAGIEVQKKQADSRNPTTGY